jgi:hypothetical protein
MRIPRRQGGGTGGVYENTSRMPTTPACAGAGCANKGSRMKPTFLVYLNEHGISLRVSRANAANTISAAAPSEFIAQCH